MNAESITELASGAVRGKRLFMEFGTLPMPFSVKETCDDIYFLLGCLVECSAFHLLLNGEPKNKLLNPLSFCGLKDSSWWEDSKSGLDACRWKAACITYVTVAGRPVSRKGDTYPGYMGKENAQNRRTDGLNILSCSDVAARSRPDPVHRRRGVNSFTEKD